MILLENLTRRIVPGFLRIILFLLAFTALDLQAQSYYFDNYTVEDELASSKVYTILQSKNHQVWLGTLSGVSRFDGIKFQNFSSDNGMASNSVRALFEDSKGNIWYGHTEGGISRFNGKKFEYLPPNYLFNKDITSFAEDNSGKIWVTSNGNGAVLILNPFESLQSIKFERYQGKRLGDIVFSCYKLKDGSIYFITNAGVKIYNPIKNTFINFNPRNFPSYFQITTICEDSRRNIWFGTYHGGLYQYIPKQDTVIIYDIRDGLSSNWISCITEDRKGNIWAGTWGGGISVINDRKIKIYNTKNGLQDNNIWSIIEDAEGNILIGTTENGLSIFKGEYMVNFSNEKSLINRQVWAILEDQHKNVWFGTDRGIITYQPNGDTDKQFIAYSPANSIIPEQIRFIKADKNQNIWIGTENAGVYKYDIKRKAFLKDYDINMKLTSENLITSMEIDHKNVLWIGTRDGLNYIDLNSLKSDRLSNANGLAGNDISSLLVTADNSIVVGSKGKGFTIIKDTIYTKFALDGNETPRCFVQDNNGTIWIGTESHGLLGYKDGQIIKRYSIKEGLLSNLVNQVICDLDGNIYVGTNKGMNKIDVNSQKIYVYTKRNGFLGIETKSNATFRNPEGHIWFGTMNGVLKYLPELDHPANLQPLTHIYRLRVNQIERPIAPDLILNSAENSIIIDYISICLTNPDAVQYQVKLEGIDTEWQPVTNQSSIIYPALPPNKYVFNVRARNSAGIWNTIPDYLAFQIMPPFYKRWYFIVMGIFIIVFLLFLYIQLRERNLITEKKILEERVQERTQEVMLINEELAMKNKDVLDSIQYAKRIQLSVLPPAIPFDNTFVLFKPKDIVSGDFFWFMSDETYEWLAAVDCTGHGVPGAFMSLIGSNSLNKIVKEMHITSPSDILNQLDEEVTKTLHQYEKGETITDGMDISLIRYNKNTHVLDFSGAFNPLWIIRKRELYETRADRFAIGRSPHANKRFTNDTTQLEPEDTVYLCTHGYADQFGGPENKKYKTGKFKEFIINIQQYSMLKQRQMLEDNIDKWRGKQVQIDDILVIGRKFRF